ncbi:MAG: non-homologous end-joining DNA ligase [Myxococcales bacterium]
MPTSATTARPKKTAVRKAARRATKARAASARSKRTQTGTSARGATRTRPATTSRKRSKAAPEALRTYHEKRDFAQTPEPSGRTAKRPRLAGGSQFVVQKHAARNLHYDFRLELDDVLLSWSVPKGPSLKSEEKRLAVRTEDHPTEYADFEGIIPKGQYGGGTVIVWDHGTWTAEGDARAGMAKGHLAFDLKGEKLRGRFHLVRTKGLANKRENWLLFKGHDAREAKANAREIVESRPESTLSGRTIEEVAQAPTRVWRSNRAEKPAGPTPKQTTTRDLIELVRNLAVGVEFSNLQKVLYPERNLRKAELIAYFASVAGLMLPHVQGRPLTLVRCPNGRAAKCFYQKHANSGVPHVLRRVQIPERNQKLEPYLALDDVAGLLALPQLGALEVHTWPCHADKVEQPDQFVFDLDPAEGLPFRAVVDAALELRQRLVELGLVSFVKTTGGKGLHVVLPVKRQLDWELHKAFALAVAEAMAQDSPKKYLTNVRKDLRRGRVYLDYLRNGRGATAIAPYSTRAREGATVATPLSWDELEPELDPKRFHVGSVLSRIGEVDPWRDYAKLRGQTVTAKARRRVGLQD